jgi:hypothetical protein
MAQRIRSHLTFANVASLIALFIALGGSATAAVIITSNSQVASGTISGHNPPAGKHPNIILASVNGQDVKDLTFQPLTLKNGWTGNCFGGGIPAVARSAEGVVYFRGEMCQPTGISENAFKLPLGFVPSKTEWLAADQLDGRTGRIVINPSGEVFVNDDDDHPGAGSAFTSLGGVNYTLPY